MLFGLFKALDLEAQQPLGERHGKGSEDGLGREAPFGATAPTLGRSALLGADSCTEWENFPPLLALVPYFVVLNTYRRILANLHYQVFRTELKLRNYF